MRHHHHTNIYKMRILERMKGGKKYKNIFEDIMAENLPNLMENINLHILEAE